MRPVFCLGHLPSPTHCNISGIANDGAAKSLSLTTQGSWVPLTLNKMEFGPHQTGSWLSDGASLWGTGRWLCSFDSVSDILVFFLNRGIDTVFLFDMALTFNLAVAGTVLRMRGGAPTSPATRRQRF